MQLRKDDMNRVSTRPAALRTIVGAAAVVAALLAFVPAASAARDPISGGTTDLHLKKGFLKKLTNLGVGLAGVGTGSVNGAKINLPVTEGMFDPTVAQGHITSPGGFQLVEGPRSVPITGVEVNTVHGFLRATIAGAHMQFGTFANPIIGREGFGARVKAGQLTLTQKAATRISNKLGLQGSQRINQRVMSNEFNITVPSTVTILGQGEATLEGSPRRSKSSPKRASRSRRGSTRSRPPNRRKRGSSPSRSRGGIVAADGSTGSVTTTGGVEILKKGKTLSPTDEDHQHLRRTDPEDGDGRTGNPAEPALPGADRPVLDRRTAVPGELGAVESDDPSDHRERRRSETAGPGRGDAEPGVQPGRRKSAPGEQ